MTSEFAPPEVAGPQAETAVTHAPPPADSPLVLDETQRVLLRSVLNRLIPPRADLPGAGDLDVGASIERSMAASTRLRRLFLDGLSDIAITSDRHSRGLFVELDPVTQTAVLESVERDGPAFFVALVEHCYRGYYTLPAVIQAIGFESRPPQPLGHSLAPFEPTLLDKQRLRLPFWRQTR
jgi:hypothetical protein